MRAYVTRLAIGAAAWIACGPAVAHDFWIEPQRFEVGVGASIPVTLQVGDGAERQRSPIPLRRIMAFGVTSPDGAYADLRGDLTLGSESADAVLRPTDAGVHVVALETDSKGRSYLPADRFNAYLEDEGLTSILAYRRATGRANVHGSERYGRRAKALVQVGDRASPSAATRNLGMTLEIVPGVDPYASDRADDLPFEVFYEGQPLAGARVKLTDLTAGNRARAVATTDPNGRVILRVPRQGAWRLTVVWSKVLPESEDVDFETVFASLTFGFAGR